MECCITMENIPNSAAAAEETDNAFEAERARIMAKNRKVLESMGVLLAAEQLHALRKQQKAKPKFSGAKRQVVVADVPTRSSRRIRGEAVEHTKESVEQALLAAENQLRLSTAKQDSAAAKQPNQPRLQLTATQYAAPFTLTSIGTTVWELGHIHRGPWQDKYWSNKGCMYHHVYPVGYVASKEVFGHVWRMTITAGEAGPIFTVCDESRGVSFSGSSPTKPWTDVCLAHRTGQRISGPLYFGFSDVHVQRAIAAMYTPQELRQAQYGSSAPATPLATTAAGDAAAESQQPQQPGVQQQLSPAELFAQELQATVSGIGAATATVLATTVSLGGAKHSSLAGLKQWLAADGRHVDQLRAFLLSSEEMPLASRHLPSWSTKWVPLILQQLLGHG